METELSRYEQGDGVLRLVPDRLIRVATGIASGLAAVLTLSVLVAPGAYGTPESDAADAITQAWEAAGGDASDVGARDGEVYQVGSGYAQKFVTGQIFFTPDTGAHLLSGPVLDRYESLGGPADSDLGFPTIDVVAGLIGPDSSVSTFSASDKPAIFWTPDTGAWVVRGPINAAWDALGGSAGTLGVPTEDERYDGSVIAQKFTGGEISWDSSTKAFTTTPSELADSLAGLEVPWDVTTQINAAWRASGGLGGPLGARQGEQSAIGDSGAVQGYAGGKIFYSPDTGAHAVTGAILSEYEAVGGPTGDLGFPIGTETDGGVANSRVSAFSAPDNPVIFWTPDTGAIIVRGPINAAWSKLDGATGPLGPPTGEQSLDGDTLTQSFRDGEISWNRATKEFSTKPADLAASLAGLELPEGTAQAPVTAGPEGTSDKSDTGFRWHWWWILIAVPVLLILILLGVLARRKSAGAEDVSYSWSTRNADERFFGGDEDAIDTAPTRIPSEAELAEFGETAFGDELSYDPGRHSVVEADFTEFDSSASSGSLGSAGSSYQWQTDSDDFGWPRRRHAADEADEADAADEADRVIEIEEDEIEVIVEADVDDESGHESGHSVDSGEVWRPAIHLPLADPLQAPEGYAIKGNTHSGLYYTPDSALYDSTVPEVWFANEDVAEANGFVKAPD